MSSAVQSADPEERARTCSGIRRLQRRAVRGKGLDLVTVELDAFGLKKPGVAFDRRQHPRQPEHAIRRRCVRTVRSKNQPDHSWWYRAVRDRAQLARRSVNSP